MTETIDFNYAPSSGDPAKSIANRHWSPRFQSCGGRRKRAVYALINLHEVPFYIGCSFNTELRLRQHISQGRQHLTYGTSLFGNRRKDEVLARMLAKGLEPTLEIIASNLDLAAALAIEREAIALIGRLEDGGTLTNIHPGGYGRTPHPGSNK